MMKPGWMLRALLVCLLAAHGPCWGVVPAWGAMSSVEVLKEVHTGQELSDAVRAYLQGSQSMKIYLAPLGNSSNIISLAGVTLPPPHEAPMSQTLVIQGKPGIPTPILDCAMREGLVPDFNSNSQSMLVVKNVTLVNLCHQPATQTGHDPRLQGFSALQLAPFFNSQTVPQPVWQTRVIANATIYHTSADMSFQAYMFVAQMTRFPIIHTLTSQLVEQLTNANAVVTAADPFMWATQYESTPAIQLQSVIVRALEAPNDPLLSSLQQQNIIKPPQYCNGTALPPPQPYPETDIYMAPLWRTDSPGSFISDLTKAVNVTHYRNTWDPRATLPPVVMVLSQLRLSPSLLPAQPLLVNYPLVLTGPVGMPYSAHLAGLSLPGLDPLLRVNSGGSSQLFIEDLTLSALVPRQLPASDVPASPFSSVFPLAAFQPLEGWAAWLHTHHNLSNQKVAPVVSMHNVTMQLPIADYLALVALAYTDKDMIHADVLLGHLGQDDMVFSQCLSEEFHQHVTVLAQNARDVHPSAVGDSCSSMSLSLFQFWGMNATNIMLVPEQPLPDSVLLQCQCIQHATSPQSQESGDDSTPEPHIVGAAAAAAVGGIILAIVAVASCIIMLRRRMVHNLLSKGATPSACMACMACLPVSVLDVKPTGSSKASAGDVMHSSSTCRASLSGPSSSTSSHRAIECASHSVTVQQPVSSSMGMVRSHSVVRSQTSQVGVSNAPRSSRSTGSRPGSGAASIRSIVHQAALPGSGVASSMSDAMSAERPQGSPGQVHSLLHVVTAAEQLMGSCMDIITSEVLQAACTANAVGGIDSAVSRASGSRHGAGSSTHSQGGERALSTIGADHAVLEVSNNEASTSSHSIVLPPTEEAAGTAAIPTPAATAGGKAAADVAEAQAALHEVFKECIAQRAQQLGGGSSNQVVVLGLLGSGSRTIYKGMWRGLPVALKTLVFRSLSLPPAELQASLQGQTGAAQGWDATHVTGSDQTRAIMEAAIAASVGHRNVVCTYHYDVQAIQAQQEPPGPGGLEICFQLDHNAGSTAPLEGHYKLYMIQELCATSLQILLDLGTLRVVDTGVVDEVPLLWVLLDIACGLEYLHGRGIIHGDLKPANVLFKPDFESPAGVVAKLSDFGLSHCLEPGATHVSNFQGGTPYFMAPEVVQQRRTSTASDMYSFGVIMWHAFTGKPLYVEECTGYLIRHPDFPHYLHPVVPRPAYCALTAWCLQHDPKQRPTARELVAAITQIIAEASGVIPVAASTATAAGVVAPDGVAAPADAAAAGVAAPGAHVEVTTPAAAAGAVVAPIAMNVAAPVAPVAASANVPFVEVVVAPAGMPAPVAGTTRA